MRRITADDLYHFKLVSEPQFAPDGRTIAFVVTTIEREANDYRSSLYLAAADGSGTRRLTHADAKDGAPRWSPDGAHLAFLSNRGAQQQAQIWLIRPDGGEAWQASRLPESVAAFAWSPDGTNFVAVSKAVEGQQEDGADKTDDKQQSDVRHITKIRYRADGEGFLDGKPKHLWLIPAFGGTARQLTNADTDDTEPAWSLNGHDIAFVTNRSDDRERNNVSEIWSISAAGSAARCLLGGDTASFGAPSWSPDGAQLAAVGNWDAASGGAKDHHLWLVPAAGGAARCVTEGYGRSIGDVAMSDIFAGSDAPPRWTPDGTRILALVSDAGSTHIQAIDVASGEVTPVTAGRRRVSALSVSGDGTHVAYVAASATNPGDLYVATIDGRDERRLTSVNADFLDSVTLAEPEEFRVASLSDGAEVHGWVLKPPGFDPARTYPMILQIHGGPHAMYAEAFMHEFQLMAARGYVVVYANPRGSSGYGEAFTTATHTAWGEKDMPDVMAAADWAAGQGYIDENRLGVTGGSYGGYMTLWVIGHTGRFRAAVTQRCVSNLHSFYGTSDIGWTFGEYEFGGTAWDRREHFMKHSPISYVANMTTPLLIVHSEEDYRCPIEQAEQVFVSLKRLGREVEFVRFPGENHNLSRAGKPKHRVERLEHIIGWFDRHL